MFEHDKLTPADERVTQLLDELLANADEGTRAKLMALDEAMVEAERDRAIRMYNRGLQVGVQSAYRKFQGQSSDQRRAARMCI